MVAYGNEIPKACGILGAGLSIRRLASLLAGRMGQTPPLLFGDAGEGGLQETLRQPTGAEPEPPQEKRRKQETPPVKCRRR